MPPEEKLRDWFALEKRALPWRREKTPYRVWISEVMLQQTQAAAVIPYFKRWMELFPTVEDLARAPYEQVVKAWEGLGYYSRVKNIHAAARYFVEEWGGEIPADSEVLAGIKGFGPYTVAAVLAFGFEKRSVAVDGNILRVFARYKGIEDSIERGKTRKRIAAEVEAFLPADKPWEVNEALIELGATVCQKTPQCARCPLQSGCVAYLENRQASLPVKKQRSAITPLHRLVAVIFSGNKVIVKKGEKALMGELYEFPYIEVEERSFTPEEKTTLFEEALQLPLRYVRTLPTQSHSFTRYKATLYPTLFSTAREIGIEGEKVLTLPFSAGHRRIRDHIFS